MMFHKMLCPTDFSEASCQGLQAAAELAQQNNAELYVLHVELPLGAPPLPESHVPYAQSDAARSAEVIANLCRIIEEQISSAVRSHPLLKRGLTAQEIVRAARNVDADLIVLTAHGATGLRSGELGSVAARVLQTSPCPVLTLCDATDALQPI
jgi:nucleotide-binding universal stress UspA family protein